MDDDDLVMFTYVFRQIVDAIEKFKMNQLLRKQAETDQLTGLYNRKMYYDRIDGMVENANKNGKTIDISLIYADLDHFKYYNDHFGHDVGDAILVEFARIFKEVSEGLGWAIRFGGDEFLLVLNTADNNVVKGVVDRIYQEIEDRNGFEAIVGKYLSSDVSIPKENRASCSIGVSIGHQINSMEEIAIIRKRADDALYRVKRNGRGYAEFTKEVEKL